MTALTVSCAPASGATGSVDQSGSLERASPRRLTAAIVASPTVINTLVAQAGSTGLTPGLSEVQALVQSTLGANDPNSELRPVLAEVLPTVENGLWVVHPDGRMETTWKIRPGALWHDGTPLTSADLAFSYELQRDPDLRLILRNANYELVDSVRTPDDHTVTFLWRGLFVDADQLSTALILPKHLLAGPAADNRAGFTDLPYWRDAFVGTGPFRLADWTPGSHAVLRAFDGYLLGRPKIDEVIFRFIPDSNTLVANVLAGEVELFNSLGISLDQALEIRDRWPGRMDVVMNSWVVVYPQLMYANPRIILEAHFRRALLMAIDRQALVDSVQGGLSQVAHTRVSPADPAYRTIEPSIVRYDYDPRRSAQMIEQLGYTKAPDGFFRNAAGERLNVTLQAVDGFDIHRKSIYPVADYWQKVGVAVDDITIGTRTQAVDREWRSTFPGFELNRHPNTMTRATLGVGTSSQARTPQNQYVGNNIMNYANPEWDALLDRYFTTIPLRERYAVLGQIVQHATDQVIHLGLMYDLEPSLIGSRLQNVAPRSTWQSHLWSVN